MDETQVKRLAKLDNLPSLPQVTSRLLEMLNDPSVSGTKVSAVLKTDPALTARMLRMVNSPFYGLRQRVGSINQAIALLGFRQVRLVVMSVAVDALFHTECTTKEFSQKGFVSHSVVSAAVAQLLAKSTGHGDPEVAFSLGLLHDIGKLAMDQCLPQVYSAAWRKAKAEGMHLWQAEATFEDQPTHAEIGGTLASAWGLPPALAEAITTHHDPDAAADKDLAAVLAVTQYVCNVKAAGSPDDFGENRLERQAWEQLGLQSDFLPSLISAIDEAIGAAQEMFEV